MCARVKRRSRRRIQGRRAGGATRSTEGGAAWGRLGRGARVGRRPPRVSHATTLSPPTASPAPNGDRVRPRRGAATAPALGAAAAGDDVEAAAATPVWGGTRSAASLSPARRGATFGGVRACGAGPAARIERRAAWARARRGARRAAGRPPRALAARSAAAPPLAACPLPLRRAPSSAAMADTVLQAVRDTVAGAQVRRGEGHRRGAVRGLPARGPRRRSRGGRRRPGHGRAPRARVAGGKRARPPALAAIWARGGASGGGG